MHIMGYFGHTRLIVQHPPSCHLIVGLTELVLMVVLNLVVLVAMAEVVFVLVTPKMGEMGYSGRLGIIIQHVFNLVVLLVMVEVVWDLGPPIYTPRKLIVDLMVVILRNLRVGIIDYVVLMVLYLTVLLVTVDVVWVLGPPTSTPKK